MTQSAELTHPPKSLQRSLRERRWSAGITQQELAELSGLSIRTISDIERGQVLCPRAATLRLLVRALGMDDDEKREFLLLAHPPSHRFLPG